MPITLEDSLVTFKIPLIISICKEKNQARIHLWYPSLYPFTTNSQVPTMCKLNFTVFLLRGAVKSVLQCMESF